MSAEEPPAAPAAEEAAPQDGAPPAWALDYETLYDRIYGAVFGHATGDAMALQLEGKDLLWIQDRALQTQEPPYPEPPGSGQHMGYPLNDWTDPTDCGVLVMRTLAAFMSGETDSPQLDLASRLQKWFKGGHGELGDDGHGRGCEGVVIRAVTRAGFLAAPVEAAREVQGPKAENGAMIRATACAFTQSPEEWAAALGAVTHADPRSLAAAVAYAYMLNRLWRSDAAAPTPALWAKEAVAHGHRMLPTPKMREEYAAVLGRSKRLADLRLDEREKSRDALKTLAVALWAYRRLIATPPAARDPAFYRKALWEVACQGGDTTSNCAVVGAIFGAACGKSIIPAAWLRAPPHFAWLQKEVDAFITAAAATWE